MTRPVALLASGGLDSTTVAYSLTEMGKETQPIFFAYGQHCVQKEWDRLNEVLPKSCLPVDRSDISDLFAGSRSRLIVEADLWQDEIQDDDLYVPYRTLLFFSAAAARAQVLGIDEVFTGFINSNRAKELDCTADFMNKLDALALAVGPVRFVSPFRYFSKAEVVREAVRLGVPIARTFSCQAASSHPCGACPNCVERLSALREAELL